MYLETRLMEERTMKEHLRSPRIRGFIVRIMTAFGIPNAVRVSVGTAKENVNFIEALKKTLDEEIK